MNMDLDRLVVEAAANRGATVNDPHFSFTNTHLNEGDEEISNLAANFGKAFARQLNIIKEDQASLNSDSDDDDRVRQNFQMLG
jgi:hypothetical protein